MWAYARIDTVTERMLKRMKSAGINWVCFGIESANIKVRKGVTKGRFDEEAVDRAITIARAAGLNILGNFMFGLPDDDIETMEETLRMAKEFNFDYVNFYVTMAYPGSQLYEEALSKGIELPTSWLGYSQYGRDTFPLATKHLTNKDVLRFRDMAFEEYFSNPKYIGMIEKKFGQEAARHIREMVKLRINRKLLSEADSTGRVR